MNKLLKISKKNNIKLIEDAACSLGSKYNNKLTGLFGDIACFSFHPRKIITTSEGGVVISKSNKNYKFIKMYKNHGLDNKKNKISFLLPGLNYRLSEINSVLGLDQIESINNKIRHRRKIAKIYNSIFQNEKDLILTQEKANVYCNYQSYHILLKNNSIRNKLKHFLYKNKIESNVGAQAIPYQHYYMKKYNYDLKDFPVCNQVFKNGLVIPIGEHITEQNAFLIGKKIIKFLKLSFN